jgi:hypothetical protein
LPLLGKALEQQGPWAGQTLDVTPSWVLREFDQRISSTDWHTAVDDVRRFLTTREQEALGLWSRDYLHQHLEALGELMAGTAG